MGEWLKGTVESAASWAVRGTLDRLYVRVLFMGEVPFRAPHLKQIVFGSLLLSLQKRHIQTAEDAIASNLASLTAGSPIGR